MARDGRGRLGLGDRLILLVAWITTCGLVYLLGFYVGEGTQARSLRVEQQVMRLPVTSPPPPEGQRPKTAPEFGFFPNVSFLPAKTALTAFSFSQLHDLCRVGISI